ncbi:hypothetical protein GURKE_02860 [Brevundimonas phage vB_BpoS-Gurke]|uniref:Uncharacterized protein n=1 Tax=Brevundimonas phage vB_BpoS-Gurke TaxID=2948599 RepID=A0A9E7N4E0_9CAUD|nr:hypothetical protein GURKE_02860 [Brevundimonas phage vB_BpoS-Gurke]
MSRPEPEENPFEAIAAAIAFSPHDWSQHHRLAWIYGIVHGWEGEALDEMRKDHGWDAATVARLQRLHARYREQCRKRPYE